MNDGEASAKARRVADALWVDDRASQGLGMELLEVGPGFAVMSMMVTETMTNGHGTAHGGFVFALADSAFAFACNSHDQAAVAAQCSITYLRPSKPRERLIATAREVAVSGRTGVYDVRVSCGDKVVAEFRGHSRVIGGSLIKGESAT